MFVAEFESKRDHDRVWEGSPWHISKHAIILENFESHMQPSELRFDRLHIWARVVNLPYNPRNDTWGLAIAKQIDEHATVAQIDPVGGFLWARVTINVLKPLRRWGAIDSAKRKKTDWYNVEYEQVPHFCFSCGRLGHSDLLCPNPGKRDENGDLPFKSSLRAPEDRKRTNSGESSTKEKHEQQNSTRESLTSASQQKSAAKEVTSPKTTNQHNWKGGPRAA